MSSLDLTREEATAFLNTQEGIPAGIIAKNYEPKELNSEITRLLDSLGTALFVLPAEPLEAIETGGQKKVIFFPRVSLKVRIVQNINLDGDRINLRALRDEVMRVLQGWEPPVKGVAGGIFLAKKPQDKAEFPGQIVYDINFIFASHL